MYIMRLYPIYCCISIYYERTSKMFDVSNEYSMLFLLEGLYENASL